MHGATIKDINGCHRELVLWDKDNCKTNLDDRF